METTVKKQTKKQAAINYFLENKLLAEREDFGLLTIITYEPDSVVIFERSNRPLYHYKFRSSEDAQKFVNDKKKYELMRIKRREDEQKKNDEKKKDFAPGKILYSCWGYEQTNIDFYVILSRKKDFVIIQEIGQTKTFDNNFNDRGSCMPDLSVKKGLPFRKKISKHASINLASYKWCGLWDGKSKGWSSYA